MYESCATCTKVGESCKGPRLENLTGEQAVALLKARKAFRHLSNQQIADGTHMSKGTVDGVFAATHTDFRFETIRPIWNFLFGGDMVDDSCNDLTDSERSAYEEKIRQLEKSVVWHEDKIQDQKDTIKDLREKNAALETLVKNNNARMTDDKKFLQEQIKSKSKAIVILSISLAVVLLVIIVALIIDRTDSSVGFFWLESLFRPQSVQDGMSLIGKRI